MLSWSDAIQSVTRPSPVYTLVGREYILMEMMIQALLSQLRVTSGDVDIQRFRFEDEGCGNALFACQSVSLFSSSSLVVLENCTGLLASGKSKHDVSELEAYLSNPVPDRVFVITVHGEKMDERKKVSKLAKTHTVVDCETPKEQDALEVVRRLAAERQIDVREDGLKELWRRTQSVSRCASELDKLWTYTDGRKIGSDDVQALVALPLEDNVFSWIDGVVKGDLERAFRALKDVEMGGYDVFALVSLIARQLRIMWYAKVLGGKGYSQQQIAGKAGAHPYAVRVAAEQARNVSAAALERLVTIVADAEFEVKSGKRDIRQALEWIVVSCAAAAK